MHQNSIIPYLYEAQHVSGDTPPIIRNLKLHWQPLVFHTWKAAGRVVGGRCQAHCAWCKDPRTSNSCEILFYPHKYESGSDSKFTGRIISLALIPLTWRIWRVPNSASKWQMRFNSAFKGLKRYMHWFWYGSIAGIRSRAISLFLAPKLNLGWYKFKNDRYLVTAVTRWPMTRYTDWYRGGIDTHVPRCSEWSQVWRGLCAK